MRKFIFIFFAAAMLAVSACSSNVKTETTTTDITLVATDSTAVDTVTVK